MTNEIAIPRGLYFEDLRDPRRFRSAGVTVTEDSIIRFALEWDAQPFHIDREAAAGSPAPLSPATSAGQDIRPSSAVPDRSARATSPRSSSIRPSWRPPSGGPHLSAGDRFMTALADALGRRGAG